MIYYKFPEYFVIFLCVSVALHDFPSPITTMFERQTLTLPQFPLRGNISVCWFNTEALSASIWSLLSNPVKNISMAKSKQETVTTNQVTGAAHPKTSTCPSLVVWVLLGNPSSARSRSATPRAGFDFTEGEQIEAGFFNLFVDYKPQIEALTELLLDLLLSGIGKEGFFPWLGFQAQGDLHPQGSPAGAARSALGEPPCPIFFFSFEWKKPIFDGFVYCLLCIVKFIRYYY